MRQPRNPRTGSFIRTHPGARNRRLWLELATAILDTPEAEMRRVARPHGVDPRAWLGAVRKRHLNGAMLDSRASRDNLRVMAARAPRLPANPTLIQALMVRDLLVAHYKAIPFHGVQHPYRNIDRVIEQLQPSRPARPARMTREDRAEALVDAY